MLTKPSVCYYRTLLQGLLVLVLLMAACPPGKAQAALGDQVLVSGAGTSIVNGIYTQIADSFFGGAQFTMVNGLTYYLCNDHSASPTLWVISNNLSGCFFGSGYYTNPSTSLTPPVAGWVVSDGTAPAPSVGPALKGAKIQQTLTSTFRLVNPGEPISYSLQISNTDTASVTSVVVTDPLPAALTRVNISSSGLSITPVGGSSYIWNVGDLTAGQSGSITVSGVVAPGAAPGTLVSNTASISASAVASGSDTSTTSFTVSWWRALGPDGFGPGGWYEPSIRMDSQNIPYVVFRNIGDGNKVNVLKYIGGSWVNVGAADFSSNGYTHPDLAFDSTDMPYVAYRDSANGDRATVMRYSGGTWQVVGASGFSNPISRVKILLSKTGVPYVAFTDNTTYKISVKRFSGGIWEDVGAPNFTGDTGYSQFSLALDGTDTPYVAFYDVSNANKATVMNFSGGTWQLVGTAGFSAGAANMIDLRLDASNTPYVGYEDGGNANKGTVMRYTGGSWQVVGSAGFTPNAIGRVSLALDPQGQPSLGFIDSSNDQVLLMRYTGSAWEQVDIAAATTPGTWDLSLAIDNAGVPHLVTYNSDKLVVLYNPSFATRSQPNPNPTTGIWYLFADGCSGVYFDSLSGLTGLTLEKKFGHPDASHGGAPLTFKITPLGAGSYQAQVRLCYRTADLHYGGIDPAQAANLHNYHFVAGAWQEFSIVDTVNRTVTAQNVTYLDGVWGIGLTGNRPTAARLASFGANSAPAAWPLLVLAALPGLLLALGLRRKRPEAAGNTH